MIEPKTLNAEEKIFEKKKNLFDNISDGKVIFYPLIQAVTFVLLYDFMRCNKLFCFLFVLFFYLILWNYEAKWEPKAHYFLKMKK